MPFLAHRKTLRALLGGEEPSEVASSVDDLFTLCANCAKLALMCASKHFTTTVHSAMHV